MLKFKNAVDVSYQWYNSQLYLQGGQNFALLLFQYICDNQGHNFRGQGATFLGQTFLKPRAGMVEIKAKDRGHNFSKLWSVTFHNF